MYLRTCPLNEDSDQPVHSRSPIRVFTGRILDNQGCSVFMRTTKTDLSLVNSSEGTFSRVFLRHIYGLDIVIGE